MTLLVLQLLEMERWLTTIIHSTADNYGVSGQTFGAFVIDPNTDTVVRQGMVDASLNRPLDKMPVCISYGGSLVLECQHSPAELVGTFWMGISPS